MGTDFHKRVVAVLEHGAQGIRKQNRLTRVPEPVLRIEVLAVFTMAGDGRVQ